MNNSAGRLFQHKDFAKKLTSSFGKHKLGIKRKENARVYKNHRAQHFNGYYLLSLLWARF